MERYRQRLSQEDQKEQDDTAKYNQAVAKFAEIVKDIIRPAMERFIAQAKSDILDFKLEDASQHPTDLRIGVWIIPLRRDLSRMRYEERPHLYYALAPRSNIITSHISTAAPGGTIHGGPNYKLEEITAANVEKDLLGVVNEILDEIVK